MANFKQDLHGLKYKNYKEIVDISREIVLILNGFSPNSISFSYTFNCDELKCHADTLEGFIEITYGATNFKLSAMQIMAHLPERQHINFNYLGNFMAGATSKILLDDFMRQLHKGILQSSKQELQQGSVSKNNVKGNTSIFVYGDNNVIGDNNIHIEEKPSEKESSKIKSFFFNVLEGITINVVWVLIGLVATIIGGCFIIN